MRKSIVFTLLLALLPMILCAQRRSTKKTVAINVSTAVNYYPRIAAYSFSRAFSLDADDIDLTYLTANSGTFIIEEGETYQVDYTRTDQFPSNLLSIGTSVQVVINDSYYHELALTRLAFSKSEQFGLFLFKDAEGDIVNTREEGYEEKLSTFAFRYEVGKYFGRSGDALRFALGASIEPSFYSYKQTPFGARNFPVTARIYAFDIAMIPMVSARMSDKVSIDFKIIPNILIADYDKIRIENPTIRESAQAWTRSYDLPEVNWAFSVLVRYQIKAPKRRRRG